MALHNQTGNKNIKSFVSCLEGKLWKNADIINHSIIVGKSTLWNVKRELYYEAELFKTEVLLQSADWVFLKKGVTSLI